MSEFSDAIKTYLRIGVGIGGFILTLLFAVLSLYCVAVLAMESCWLWWLAVLVIGVLGLSALAFWFDWSGK